MYTQEQILDMYFDRNQQAVSATSQMYGAKLTRFADTMVAHEDALECVNDTYIAAWNKIPPERPMRFLSWLYRVCRNIVCDRIDWNNASKRNSNMNCMLDELEECLADSNAKIRGRAVGHWKVFIGFSERTGDGKESAFRETLLVWHGD